VAEPAATPGDDDGPGGFDLTRTLALTDGVFAISLTLLVLDLILPDTLSSADEVNHALGELMPNLLALALTFVVIGRYWIGHHQTFRVIDRADVPLMWLNLLFLASIALMPFTTRLLAAYGQFAVPTAVYAANIAAAALTSAAIHWWAITRLHHDQVRSPVESGTLVVALVFLASIPVALLLDAPNAAKLVWLATPVVGTVVSRLRH
jgi:uncharacterized membrane protein